MKKYLSVLLLLFAFVLPFNAQCNAQMIWENTQYPKSSDAGAWNNVYERKDLLAEFTLDQLSAKIAAGDFSGIPIGSYIETDIKPSVDGAVLALSGNSTSGTTAYDISGNANNATMNNVTLSADTDKAFVFDGTSSKISLPNIFTGATNVSSVSVVAKIKTTATSGVIFKALTGTSSRVELSITSRKLRSGARRLNTETFRFCDTNVNINDGNWHDAVGIFDFSTGKVFIYLDGVLNNSSDLGSSGVLNTSDINTVEISSSSAMFNGEIKGVKVYFNKILTDSEIAQLHTATQDEGLTERVRWLVAGLDHFLHNGSAPINDHHLLMVAEDCLKNTTKMNDTNTTVGGYFGSYFYTAVRGHIGIGKIAHLFDPSNSIFITNSVDTTLPSMAGAGFNGASNGCSWKPVGTQLMSEVELYGTTVLSSSFYDVGNSRSQFPLFRLRPDLIHANKGIDKSAGGRQTYWLRAIADSSDFCVAQYQGVASRSNASMTQGIRLFCLFK